MLVIFDGGVLCKNSGCFLCKGCFIQCYRFIFMGNSRAPWSFKYAKYNKKLNMHKILNIRYKPNHYQTALFIVICLICPGVKLPIYLLVHAKQGHNSNTGGYVWSVVWWCLSQDNLLIMALNDLHFLITDKDEQTFILAEQSFALVLQFDCCHRMMWMLQRSYYLSVTTSRDRDITCFSMCAYFKVNLNMI